jgi:hypothetical protein
MLCRRLRQSVSQIPASCVADPRIRPYSSLLFYFSYLLSHNWVGIGQAPSPPVPAALAVVLFRPAEIGVGAPDGSAMKHRDPRAGNMVTSSASIFLVAPHPWPLLPPVYARADVAPVAPAL